MGNEQQKQEQMRMYQQQQAAQQQAAMQAQKKQMQQQKARQLEIDGEKHTVNLGAQLAKMDDLIRKKQAAAQTLEARIKQLIAQGRKNDAKRQVATLKQLNQQLTLYNTRRMVVAKQKNQLEIASIDVNMAGTMSEANNFMKESGNIGEKMQDVLMDQREIQQNMAETNDLFNQMAANDNQEEEEDLFKELEKEVNTQKAQQISAQLAGPQQVRPVQVQQVYQQVYQQPVQQQKQVYQPQQYAPVSTVGKPKQAAHMDDIERMLNS